MFHLGSDESPDQEIDDNNGFYTLQSRNVITYKATTVDWKDPTLPTSQPLQKTSHFRVCFDKRN